MYFKVLRTVQSGETGELTKYSGRTNPMSFSSRVIPHYLLVSSKAAVLDDEFKSVTECGASLIPPSEVLKNSCQFPVRLTPGCSGKPCCRACHIKVIRGAWNCFMH